MAMKGNAQNQMTLGQLREFHIRVLAALPLNMSWEVAQGWIQNPRSLAEALAGVLMPVTLVEAKVLADWQQFYSKFFGIRLDFSGVKIPEKEKGFDRLIVVAEDLTLNQAYDACSRSFPCRRCADNLDKAIAHNDREPTETYAIWVRDRREADKELKNLSAQALEKQGVKGITLLERLLLELVHWDEIEPHLDIRNVTLCAGSRRSDGCVPRVGWDGVKLEVGWSSPDDARPDLRARAIVS